jgi:hypothetical protein
MEPEGLLRCSQEQKNYININKICCSYVLPVFVLLRKPPLFIYSVWPKLTLNHTKLLLLVKTCEPLTVLQMFCGSIYGVSFLRCSLPILNIHTTIPSSEYPIRISLSSSYSAEREDNSRFFITEIKMGTPQRFF